MPCATKRAWLVKHGVLQVAVAVKVNTLPGEPVCGCTMGGVCLKLLKHA